MKMDLRLPLGALFGVLGLLICAYGYVSPPEVYRKSLGINVDLWWGGVLVLFGLSMLALARRASRRARRSPQQGE